MFKVFSSPATVTIFHNSKIPLSESLKHILFEKLDKVNATKSSQFAIDLMENKMPTFDQYKSLITMNSTKVKLTYPLLSDRLDLPEKTIFKGTPNLFNQGEYSIIYDAFNEAVADPTKPIDPSHIFKAPLVVDWDQSKVAISESDLYDLLSAYKDH